MDEQGKKIAADHAAEIKKEEAKRSKIRFYQTGKEQQRDHVKDEMQPAYMQETGTDQPAILFFYQYAIHFKHETFVEKMIVQPAIGEQYIIKNEKDGYDSGLSHNDSE